MKKKCFSQFVVFLSLALIIFINACKKDKGNYNLKTINEISVEGIPSDTVIKLLVGDKLYLKPIIKQQTPSNYSYRWYCYNEKKYELSNTLDLDTTVTLPIGSYLLQFEVTDNTTGIKAFKEMQLQISGKYTFGLVVLEQTQQGGDISHIGLQDTVFRHLYSLANGNSHISSPSSKLIGSYFPTTGGNSGKKELLYVSSDDQASFELDIDTYMRNEIPSNTFTIGATYPIQITNIHPNSYFIGAVVNKKLQFSNNGVIPIRFVSAIPGDYELAPFILSPSGRQDGFYYSPIFIVFDEKNGRFLNYWSYGVAPFETYSQDIDGSTDGGAFNLNNIPNKKCFFAYYSNTYRYYNWFMKDVTNNETWLYRVGYEIGPSAAYAAIKIPASTRFSESKLFAASTTLPHVYYALENSIYLYDYVSNQSRVVYTFPANTQITEMKFAVSRSASINENFLSEFTTSDLFIATYDGAQGKISKFKVQSSGNLTTPVKEFTGFAKVTSMFYR